ncbi:hypothetical protein SCG7086_AB_00350 [Chlamydiales bacterium SCGC AG-110-P3]|nr:hypothetical protein SCG7086_AB_00350 [Chlamydiales bacterium SCGC AG-110-P3]
MRLSIMQAVCCVSLLVTASLPGESGHGSDWLQLGTGTDPVVVDAEFGHYDGDSVTLRGGVALDHQIGTLKAREAILTRASSDREDQFSRLDMQGNIRVLMTAGGCFHCANAELDFNSLTGRFYGDDFQEYVTYTDNLNKEGVEQSSLVLRSRHMAVEMNRLDSEGDEPLLHNVQQITADQNVTVDYNREFMAAGDHMVYQRYQNGWDADDGAVMPGVIYLRPSDFYGVCQVTSRRGDLIKAQEIEIDVPLQIVTFDKPKGAVYVAAKEEEHQRIDFSSETLSWDQRSNLLTLRNKVVLYQKVLGKLTCTDKALLCQEMVDGSRELKWIEATGTTEMTYLDEANNDTHYLVCHGRVYVDASNRITTLDAPSRTDGMDEKNAIGKQVYFEDCRGMVYADHVRLDYDLGDDGVAPKKLTVSGNVKILNRSADGSGSDGPAIQYALADVVEYVPGQEQMVLYANEDRRVLFYDRINKVQVSAPAVNVRRDGTTGKETVEGIGDVRFTFASDEMNALHENFDFEAAYR